MRIFIQLFLRVQGISNHNTGFPNGFLKKKIRRINKGCKRFSKDLRWIVKKSQQIPKALQNNCKWLTDYIGLQRIPKDLQDFKELSTWYHRIYRISKDLQDFKGFTGFQRIYKISKNIQDFKGFARFQRIYWITKDYIEFQRIS